MMNLTIELARSLRGSIFSVATADPQQPISLRLDDVCESSAQGQYVQFSLLFSGTLDTPLVQQTFLLSHPQLEQLPVFLVPISKSEDSVQYQAIFSYPRS